MWDDPLLGALSFISHILVILVICILVIWGVNAAVEDYKVNDVLAKQLSTLSSSEPSTIYTVEVTAILDSGTSPVPVSLLVDLTVKESVAGVVTYTGDFTYTDIVENIKPVVGAKLAARIISNKLDEKAAEPSIG